MLRTTIVSASLLGALAGPAALAGAAPAVAAACDSAVYKHASPAVGGTGTALDGVGGSFSFTRTTTTMLKIGTVSPASGWSARVVKAGPSPAIKVNFLSQTSSAHIRVTVHLGNDDKEKLYVVRNTCS